jgi:hypothetical protein
MYATPIFQLDNSKPKVMGNLPVSSRELARCLAAAGYSEEVSHESHLAKA